jgi:hypothetical protein
MQRMTSHRNISLTLTLLAVFVTFAPSSALANSLLSGYGGPGEGNQAILGSALVGGAGGAGGGGSSSGSSGSSGGSTGSIGSSSSATTGGASAAIGEAASTGSSERGSTVGGGSRSAAGRTSHSRSGGREASGGAAHAYPVSSRDEASQSTTSGGSEALGLPAADLGYVLLVLGALGVTGVVTRRLAQAPSRPEGP